MRKTDTMKFYKKIAVSHGWNLKSLSHKTEMKTELISTKVMELKFKVKFKVVENSLSEKCLI